MSFEDCARLGITQKDYQDSVEILEASNKVTYITKLWRQDHQVLAVVATVFLGFLIAPIQCAIYHFSNTRTYDQLCEKLAKAKIEVMKLTPEDPGYQKKIEECDSIRADLQGRIAKLSTGIRGVIQENQEIERRNAAKYASMLSSAPSPFTFDEDGYLEDTTDYDEYGVRIDPVLVESLDEDTSLEPAPQRIDFESEIPVSEVDILNLQKVSKFKQEQAFQTQLKSIAVE
jgi:hypothetical protein